MSSKPAVGWLARIAFGLGSYAEGIKSGAFSYFLLFYYNQALGLSGFSHTTFLALLKTSRRHQARGSL